MDDSKHLDLLGNTELLQNLLRMPQTIEPLDNTSALD